ncbi:MAG: hypothetical protein C0505_08850 [Leptothrix sp. (in: Bacteria)]|nr:hypothetical protein [Leptothrix sp. (in: b-proteobacteria)]
MILVLPAAALLSGAIGDVTDTPLIFLTVGLYAAIGFWQSWHADRALQAPQRLAAPHATVRREAGQVKMIKTEQLVPGDVVLLEAAYLVPADLRLHDVAQLRVDGSDPREVAGTPWRRGRSTWRPGQHSAQGRAGHARARGRAGGERRRADHARPRRAAARRRRGPRDATAAPERRVRAYAWPCSCVAGAITATRCRSAWTKPSAWPSQQS